MRFVPVKGEDQQARLMVHRARQAFVEARTATINCIRGLLAEFGLVNAQEPQGAAGQAGRPARGRRQRAQRHRPAGAAGGVRPLA
jgi:transposase